MPHIDTPFGPIDALPNVEHHPNGALRSCIAAAASPLHTPYGVLEPQYQSTALRNRKLPAISFHENGMFRNLPLNDQTPVATPLGILPAEQVTFYDTGALHRVFPLNGCLSGYWSQEDEGNLAQPLDIDTPLGAIHAALVALRFSSDGKLLGLTLWPGEVVDIATPAGTLPVRVGISFTTDGALRSMEPAKPVVVPTPLGDIYAFDPDAIGVSGDVNSLGFDEHGTICRFSTLSHVFEISRAEGETLLVEPPMRVNPCDGETREPGPLHVIIHNGMATFSSDTMQAVSAPLDQITTRRFAQPLPKLGMACGMNASFM